MQPAQPPGGRYPTAAPVAISNSGSLGARAGTLFQRVIEVERLLAAQEWWLLARAVPEAQVLSEVVSLLAVGRGELEDLLARFFERPAAAVNAGGAASVAALRLDDPAWLRASREQALALLRLAMAALPAMAQYARMLRDAAARQGMPAAAVDALAIVAERLQEACETLTQPPGVR